MMKKYLPVLLISLFFFACKESTPEEIEQDKMHDVVMEIHDAVMPEMSTINRISRGLKKFVKNNQPDSLQNSQIESSIAELENADEAMMDWMQKYKKPGKLRGDKSHVEIMEYLKSEEAKISEVKKLMEESIEKGNALLENLEQ